MRNKRVFGLFLLMSLLINNLTAQSPTVEWAKFAGSNYNEYPQQVVIDKNGNSYVVGYFEGTSLTFGNYTISNNCSGGGSNCFRLYIAKFDSLGNVLWAKGATQSDYSVGMSIALDNQNNVIIGGFFKGYKLVFGTQTIYHPGPFDNSYGSSFIVKYDSNGNVIWAKGANTSNSNAIYYIKTDNNNNLYITGHFQDYSLNYDNVTLYNPNYTNQESYIIKLDSDGKAIWGKTIGGNLHDVGRCITTDNTGNVYVDGYFMSSSINIDGKSFYGKGNRDAFIFKFDSSGTLLWGNVAGGTNVDEASGLTVDINGNVFMSGNYKSSQIVFDNDTLKNSSTGYNKPFIVKYDINGNVVWAKTASGTGSIMCNSIFSDLAGSIFTTGSFNGNTASFNDTALTNTSQYTQDMYISEYTNNGDLLWMKKYGGENDENGTCISVGNNSKLYVLGTYTSPKVVFDSFNATNSNSSYSDMFLLAFDLSTDTIDVNYCSSENQITLSGYDGYTSYTWKNQAGVIIGSAKDITIQNPADGALYKVEMTSTGGSQNLVFRINRIDTSVDFDFTSSCSSNTVNFTNLSTTNKGNLTYNWNFGDGNTSTLQNPVHTYSSIGNYNVKLTISNSEGGCEESIEKSVETFIASNVNVTGETTFCYGKQTTLTASGAVNYKWNTGATSNSIVVNNSGRYWLIGSSTTGKCVADTIFIDVTELPDWELNITGDSILCEGESTSLIATGAVSYMWNTSENTSSINVNKTGTYTVTGTNSDGCVKTSSFKVIVSEYPLADFTFEPSILEHDKRVITEAATISATAQNDVQYTWDLGDGTIISGNPIEHTYNITEKDSVFYVTLTAINKYGCETTNTQRLIVLPFIPNVFTPDGDGINDIFVPYFDIKIYDRNGLLLYSGNKGWDGTYNGKPMDPDTYFYYLTFRDANNLQHILKGYVTLIR